MIYLYVASMLVLLAALTGCTSSRNKPDLSMFPECMTGPEAYCWVYWKNDHEPLIRVGRSRRDVYDPDVVFFPFAPPECIDLDLDGDGDVDLEDVAEVLR